MDPHAFVARSTRRWDEVQETTNEIYDEVNERCGTNVKPTLWERK